MYRVRRRIAPGPGYLSVEPARTGRYTVTGVDISATFVDIARAQARAAGRVRLVGGH